MGGGKSAADIGGGSDSALKRANLFDPQELQAFEHRLGAKIARFRDQVGDGEATDDKLTAETPATRRQRKLSALECASEVHAAVAELFESHSSQPASQSELVAVGKVVKMWKNASADGLPVS